MSRALSGAVKACRTGRAVMDFGPFCATNPRLRENQGRHTGTQGHPVGIRVGWCDREWLTVDLYRKRPGGEMVGRTRSLRPGRFGSSRKKEAAGAARRNAATYGVLMRISAAA
jgi:hypothetical protein